MRKHGWLSLFISVVSLLAFAHSNLSYGQRGNVHWAAGSPFMGDLDENALEGEAGRVWNAPLNWLEDAVPLEATDIVADHTQIFGTDHVRDPIITTDVGQMGRLLLYSGADLTLEAGGAIETERIWIGQGTDFSNLDGDISSTLTINGGTLISSSDIQPGVGNEFHPGTLQLNSGFVQARGIFMGNGSLVDLSFMNIVDGDMDLNVLSLNPSGNPKVDISGIGTITVDNDFDPPWDPGNIFDNVAGTQAAIQAGHIIANGGTGVVELDTTSIPGRIVISAVRSGSAADLNMDGFVDGLDLGILLGNFNQSGIATAGGELNGTDPVDGLDLGILLGAWNPPVLRAATGVPEPGSAILMLLATAASLLARSQRQLI